MATNSSLLQDMISVSSSALNKLRPALLTAQREYANLDTTELNGLIDHFEKYHHQLNEDLSMAREEGIEPSDQYIEFNKNYIDEFLRVYTNAYKIMIEQASQLHEDYADSKAVASSSAAIISSLDEWHSVSEIRRLTDNLDATIADIINEIVSLKSNAEGMGLVTEELSVIIKEIWRIREECSNLHLVLGDVTEVTIKSRVEEFVAFKDSINHLKKTFNEKYTHLIESQNRPLSTVDVEHEVQSTNQEISSIIEPDDEDQPANSVDEKQSPIANDDEFETRRFNVHKNP